MMVWRRFLINRTTWIENLHMCWMCLQPFKTLRTKVVSALDNCNWISQHKLTNNALKVRCYLRNKQLIVSTSFFFSKHLWFDKLITSEQNYWQCLYLYKRKIMVNKTPKIQHTMLIRECLQTYFNTIQC